LTGGYDSEAELAAIAESRLTLYLNSCRPGCALELDPQSAVDTVLVSAGLDSIIIRLNDAFAQVPFRDEKVSRVYNQVERVLGPEFESKKIELVVRGQPLEELVPNYYRIVSHSPDAGRRPRGPREFRQHVLNTDRPITPSAGLAGKHIAVWPSHGWYYEAGESRWEWQRSRLFQTVEDLLPMSFITPYLAPMLERAGARVYIPRERDPQFREAIVDNDDFPLPVPDEHLLPVSEPLPPPEPGYVESDSLGPWFRSWKTASNSGYATGTGVLTGSQNPFKEGTHRYVQTDSVTSASSAWLPDIPATGEYAVYISYGSLENPALDAHYTVHHLGGQTSFLVDQSMGASTWTYLGTFLFSAGVDMEHGAVTLENESIYPGTFVSGDGVRFGGGMGNVVRGQSVSGRPRFAEAARYYMQFSGMPDTLVYNVTESLNDYVDDYRGRAEWVNYLRGAPAGPNKDRSHHGLGIPIDLSMAFHTDAGITPDSKTIGTLMIYSSAGYESEGNFPDGMSRAANRDLGDIMQSQIVNDIRALHDSSWTRRALWDRDYSEAVRPNIPGVLLELQSHQNFADMKFGLDPGFRSDVSRAVYKAMLRFLAYQEGRVFIVQPLPVKKLTIEWIDDQGEAGIGSRARLRWQDSPDPLEESASATGFIVYRRDGQKGFDNGTYTSASEWIVDDLTLGIVTSFRVSAVNDGGESSWSSVVSVGTPSDIQLIKANLSEAAGLVLVVDNFDRISGPGTLDTANWKGFMSSVDEGVPDGVDVSYVGEQYDFDPSSAYLDDDAPGHGASYATFETWPRVGNTRDYAAVHGEAILDSGFAFMTSTGAAFRSGEQRLDRVTVIDFLLGEQRTIMLPGDRRGSRYETFDDSTQRVIKEYLEGGGRVFASGAFIGTDLVTGFASTEDKSFAKDVLKFTFQTNHASQTGRLVPSGDVFADIGIGSVAGTESVARTGSVVGTGSNGHVLAFNIDPRVSMYRVESPDAITPSRVEGETLLRYAENGSGAAIGDRSGHPVVVFGFPFESLVGSANRTAIMRRVLNYLMN